MDSTATSTSANTPNGPTTQEQLLAQATALGQSYLKRAGALNQAQEAVMLEDLQQTLAMNREQVRADYQRVNKTELPKTTAESDQMHVGDVNITYSGPMPPQQITTNNAAMTAAQPSQSVQADAAPGVSPSPVAAPSALPTKLANLGKLAAIAAAFATAGAGGAYVASKVLAPSGTDTDTQYQLELVEPIPDSTQPQGG